MLAKSLKIVFFLIFFLKPVQLDELKLCKTEAQFFYP